MLLLGLILSVVAVASCKFVDIVEGGDYTTSGLFSATSSDGSCQRHDSENTSFTRSENVARMSGVLAPCFSALALLWIMCESRCVCRILTKVCVFGAFVFQSLTFLWFGSTVCGEDLYKEITTQKPCTLDEGANASVAATVLFFLSMFTVSIMPPPYKKSTSSNAREQGEADAEDGMANVELNGKGVLS